jgi:Maleate cis-trans isomerase
MLDAGAPAASTTSGALIEALELLGVSRLGIATPYVEPVTRRLVGFLAEHGVRTVSCEGLGLLGHIWRVTYTEVVEIVRAVDSDEAQALFISCTNLPTYDLIEPLEQALGKPVLTANQVTMWAALKAMGRAAVGGGMLLNASSHPQDPPSQEPPLSATRSCMTPTIGILYPGYSAEDDYPRAEALLRGPRLALVHTEMREDAHRVDALLDIGADDVLASGLTKMPELDAVVWACTSGSFVFGWDGATAQVAALGAAAGVPASSTSFAFVDACRRLGVTRVAVGATYPDEVAQRFVTFLATAGIEVLALSARGIVTAAEVGTLAPEVVLEFAAAADRADAQAVLLPDTALHTVELLDALDARVGKPVLTANQVSIWQGLCLAGADEPRTGLGRLFAQAS